MMQIEDFSTVFNGAAQLLYLMSPLILGLALWNQRFRFAIVWGVLMFIGWNAFGNVWSV